MNIISLIASDNFLVVNRGLIKSLGLQEAVLLCELCSEYCFWESQDRLDPDGEFYSTQENIQENTGLSEYQQREALKSLESQDLIKVIKKGLPAKNYYKINEQAVLKFLKNQSSKNSSTGALKTQAQDPKKLKINNNKEKIIKNNTKDKRGNFLDQVHKKCLEYDIQDEAVISKLDEFIEVLLDNKVLVTAQKAESIISKLAKVDKATQLNAIQLSLDHGYKNIDPEWLNSNNKKGGEHLNLPHDKESWQDHNNRIQQLQASKDKHLF